MISENVSLKDLNTFGFESTARYFTTIRTEDDLVKTIQFSKNNQLKLLPLGGGSNILAATCVENALVAHIQIMGRTVQKIGSGIELKLGAGENWHETVQWAVESGYVGLEAMALIPGQVGAAPVQNIGAYGTELKDLIISLRAYDVESEAFVELDNESCQFKYRDSIFKRSPGRYLISQITLKLEEASKQSCKIKYDGLAQYLEQKGISQPTAKDVFVAVCNLRQAKLPDPKVIGNAGSFFKNPVVEEKQYLALKEKWPELVAYPEQSGHYKLAAGWMIDRCGWKGHVEGNVGVYSKQALVLVNHGGGSLEELMQLVEKIRNSVRENFSVELEVEPQPFV